MTKEELEKEAEEKTKQYMNEHTEKYNCENTKLETDNYNAGREYGYEEGYLAGAEPREKQIVNLRKENAKLKTDYGVLSCSVGDFGELQDKLEEEQRKNNGLSDNLTKAKELLKESMNYLDTYHNAVKVYNFIAEAEQFINSEVEK